MIHVSTKDGRQDTAKQERIRRSERASTAIARLRRQGRIRQIAAELGQSAMTIQRAVTAA